MPCVSKRKVLRGRGALRRRARLRERGVRPEQIVQEYPRGHAIADDMVESADEDVFSGVLAYDRHAKKRPLGQIEDLIGFASNPLADVAVRALPTFEPSDGHDRLAPNLLHGLMAARVKRGAQRRVSVHDGIDRMLQEALVDVPRQASHDAQIRRARTAR